mmetsp:Transcript_13001/g.22082  ORF Transcript_13001/g.22082 Transcript_13001/m.22082 type:complete len:496 (-) Transcript_13001:977-2464(-)
MTDKPTIVALPPEEQKEPDNSNQSVLDDRNTVANLSSPWEFDDEQPYCASCASEFNPLNRRHHCRFCGKIFCGRCSQKKALIPPSSIVLAPKGGKKAKPRRDQAISFSPDDDPDRMLTYVGDEEQILYGKGLEERFKLARDPLRVCNPCYVKLQPVQEDLRKTNSNAMRFNTIDPTDARRMFNSPLAFTLGHEVRKAAYTLGNLLPQPKRMGSFTPVHHHQFEVVAEATQQCRDTCSTGGPNLGGLDGVRIPARLVEMAKGIATLTVAKGGFGLAGVEFGTGLVVARLPNGQWSAPSAIGAAGISWGALIGAQVSDHVFLLMTDKAVEMMFAKDGSINLGADVGVALGPLGRALEGNVGAAVGTVAPIYTYSLSKGLYAGVSLDGKVIVTRHNVNEKFYGQKVTGADILMGQIPTPPAAQPLYDALTRCHVYATGARPGNSRSTNIRPIPEHAQDNSSLEYGEFVQPVGSQVMPPANDDQHSYAGLSELTSDPGY